MLTVNNFLCWFKLETGGRIIGWSVLIGNLLLAVTSWSGAMFLSINNCYDLKKLGGNGPMCPYLRGAYVGVLLLITIGCLLFAFLGWKCNQGMKTRNPTRIARLMILLAMVTVFYIIPAFTRTLVGIIGRHCSKSSM